MRTNLHRKNLLFKTKAQTNNQQALTTTMREMNGTKQQKVDGHIVERSKLLIWSENTYKHKGKKKSEGEGEGRSGE
jgi:hypothetical protein